MTSQDDSNAPREPDPLPGGGGPLGDALQCSVSAAEAAIQATAAIWHQMSVAERDEWLADAVTVWPRFDVFLRYLLPVSEQIVEAEARVFGQARGGDRPRPSEGSDEWADS